VNGPGGRPPALSWRWLAAWLVLPALLGGVASASVDASAPPLVGPERLWAVLFLDGQAYFGHIADAPGSDTIVLTDVYYLQDARSSTTNLPLALVKRGEELHSPRDGMRIRREKILAVERVGPGSAVARAIAADRALRGQATR